MTGSVLGASLGAATIGTLALGAYYQNCALFGPVIGRGPRRERALYLTFDDGPNPTATGRIAETLALHGVPAAFFVVGAHVKRHPDLVRTVARAGHEVGNHTQHHVKLHWRGPGTISRELEECHGVVADATGRAPRAFRAPHGYRNPFVTFAAHRLGYAVFGWTFGVSDSACPGSEEIRRRVRNRLRAGAVVLLHDGDGYEDSGDRRQTADALPGIIRDARDAGYAFRPLRELLG